jgi:hypothetical protein
MPQPNRNLWRATAALTLAAALTAGVLTARPTTDGRRLALTPAAADSLDHAPPTTIATTTTTSAPAPPPAPPTTQAPAVVAPEGEVSAAVLEPTTPPDPPVEGVTADAVRQAFGDRLFGQAWRVSGCESGHDPTIVSAGGGNWGLFQLNTVHADAFEEWTGQPFHDGALDPYANASYARHLYDESGGWGPWACRWAA